MKVISNKYRDVSITNIRKNYTYHVGVFTGNSIIGRFCYKETNMFKLSEIKRNKA
jgi:hypothetical protein